MTSTEDTLRADKFVRTLLEARVGPVAWRIDDDEPFADVGISSVDLVTVVAAIERDAVNVVEPVDFIDVARSCTTLAAYYLILRGTQ